MVTAHSSRTISYPSDRLSALAGIAESILRERDTDYLAGIWSHDLAAGLCWRVLNRVARKIGEDKDAACTGPTWSWASMERSVFYGRWSGFKALVLLLIIMSSLMALLARAKFVRGGPCWKQRYWAARSNYCPTTSQQR